MRLVTCRIGCDPADFVIWVQLNPASILTDRVHTGVVKIIPRLVATVFAMSATLGVAGVGAAVDAQAQPGPFPQWYPGEFWDPGWGDNWDGGRCHDNFRSWLASR